MTAASAVPNIAVFASGSGSNFEAIMQDFDETDYALGRVALLVCDQPNAYVLQRAQKWGTPTFVVSPKDFESKAKYEQAIVNELNRIGIDFIVLAGYMRLMGPTLLQPFMGQVINIHPSLLPAFQGLNAVGQALEYGVRVSGVTIHFVDSGMDTGPIIAQKSVDIDVDETKESLTKKIQRIEHRWYPEMVKYCVEGKVQFTGGKVHWL